MADGNKWYSYWPIILAVPLGLVLLKTIPKTDFYKELTKDSRIKSSVYISASFNSNKINLVVNNTNSFAFKDLTISCKFRDQSGNVLENKKYTINKTFFSGGKMEIKSLTANDIPKPANNVSCFAKELTTISEEESTKQQKQLLDEIFGKKP